MFCLDSILRNTMQMYIACLVVVWTEYYSEVSYINAN